MKAERKKDYVAPAGHEDFVAEFRALLARFPKSASRFKLADMGETPTTRWTVTWECENIGEFGIDCRPVAEQ